MLTSSQIVLKIMLALRVRKAAVLHAACCKAATGVPAVAQLLHLDMAEPGKATDGSQKSKALQHHVLALPASRLETKASKRVLQGLTCKGVTISFRDIMPTPTTIAPLKVLATCKI